MTDWPTPDPLLRRHDAGMFVRHLDAEGEADGTVLWIHGLGESGLSLERVVSHPALRAWSHLVPDLLGYGKSLWPPEPPSLDDHAAHLEEWLMLLEDVGPLVVVGHSMGGVVGTLLCERLSERVLGFANVEGNVSIEDCGYSSRADAYSLDDWLDHGKDEVTDRLYRGGVEDPTLRTYHASIVMGDPRVFHRNARELVEMSRAEDLAARLGRLDLPTVYLYGDPRGTGERSRALLRDAGVDVRSVPDAGHWPFLDQPQRFVEEVASFLDSLDV